MYLDEIYSFCLKYFAKFCILTKISAKNHDFYDFFLWFHHENRLVDNFHYHIRNQRKNLKSSTF